MKKIELSQGQFAKVCDCHFDLVAPFKWHYRKGYARRNIKIDGRWTTQLMHKFIKDTPDNLDTDHINRDGLDNRCENLRAVSHRVNGMNRGKNSNNSSGYKGVSWDGKSNKWRAVIGFNGVYKVIGRFEDKKDAAKAYEQEVLRVLRWL